MARPRRSAGDAGAAGAASLERSLRFGASSAGDFHAHVRPRLEALATSRLARVGIDLADEPRARAALGPVGYELVAPGSDPHPDRAAPGVPLEAVAALVDAMSALGERP